MSFDDTIRIHNQHRIWYRNCVHVQPRQVLVWIEYVAENGDLMPLLRRFCEAQSIPVTETAIRHTVLAQGTCAMDGVLVRPLYRA